MSGIAGVYNLDGRPLRREQLEQMNCIQAHRGPDGNGLWFEGPVGLGHRLLWTTVESLREKLPIVSADRKLILTADARIDNRNELIDALGIESGSVDQVSDNTLILAAYSKWGTFCPEHLLGDFAFVLWDRRDQSLFCARDHFGVKPLYYFYYPGHLFAFASEIKGLLCLSEIPRQLNEVQVADYLLGLFEDKTSTFYQNILRLPPAHSLTVTAQGIRARCYWSLDPSSELRLKSDDEYAEAFRESFTEAVQCRLRSAFLRGSHLSGGLDSSAVTCVAHKLLESTNARLHIFSNIFDNVPECDERPFINAVLAQREVIPHFVHADRSSPLSDLERVFWYQDEPSIGPNHFLPWGLNRAASEAGVRVILDGFDGDTTISHGAARLTELAYAGEWEKFAREAQAVSAHFNVTPLGLLQGYGLTAVEELAKHQRWLAFAAAINQINRVYRASRRQLLWRHGLRPLISSQIVNVQKASQSSIDPIINSDFARRLNVRDRIQLLNAVQLKTPRTAREDQWRNLTSGLFTSVLELSDRCAAAFSVEGRHPFMDKRLIELCLALPASQKLSDGWSRIVMRRAMSGIVPEEIRWRGGKTDMNPNFLRGFLVSDRIALDQAIFNHAQVVEKYIDISHLRQLYQRLIARHKANIYQTMTLWKVVTLTYWLRSAAHRDNSQAKTAKSIGLEPRGTYFMALD